MRKSKTQIELAKDKISENATLNTSGLFRNKREYKDQNAEIIIKNCGVYVIGMDPRSRVTTSAVGRTDFRPKFIQQK